jgi:hypothetical protein
LAAVSRFRERHGRQATVECVDARLPASLSGSEDGGLVANVLASAAGCFETAGLAKLPCFYELPSASDYRQATGVVAGVLAALDRGLTAGALRDVGLSSLSLEEPVLDRSDQGDRLAVHGTAGIKLRCGGLQPSAVPTADQVASVIEESVRGRRPLKFTAGLHSPIRRVDPALGIHVHGFLNVFAAAMLTAAMGLEHPDVVAIVEEEDFREFRFSEDFFAWNEAEVTIGEIEYARRHQAISFGSCSFEEPRDELRSLGLI